MVLLAQNELVLKSSPDHTPSPRSAPKSLLAVIKDGARLMITPALAERIIVECFYAPQTEREVGGERHIRLLAVEMAAGRFTPGTQIHFAAVGEKLYLLDGYHRLRAIIESGRSTEFSILRDEASSVAALGPLYWRHDFVARPRPMVLAAVVSGKGEGLGKQRMAAAMAAVALLASNFARGGEVSLDLRLSLRSPDVRLAAYRAWVKHAEAYFDAVASATTVGHKRFNRAGVLAVGMATFKHQPAKAGEFWRAVAADDGLRQGDPRKALVRFLMEGPLYTGSSDVRVGVALATALCWNAWFEGRQLTFLRRSTENFYIAGTPFARKFQKRGKE